MVPTQPSADLELVAERSFAANVDRVWELCTTKRGLERWWSPETLRTTVTRWEGRLGGEVSMALRYLPAMLGPKGESEYLAAGIPITLRLHGRVVEWERHRRVAFELTLTLDRAGAGITNVTRLEFEPLGPGTLVRLVVTGKSEPHLVTLGKTNLEGQLDRLGRCLDESPAST